MRILHVGHIHPYIVRVIHRMKSLSVTSSQGEISAFHAVAKLCGATFMSGAPALLTEIFSSVWVPLKV